MPTRQFQYTLFADYFHFYIQDESADGDLSDSWTEEAVERLLALAPGTLGIGTVRNMEVPVTVELIDTEPPSAFDGWDHIVECSVDVPSGRIVVAGCTDYFPDAARINVPAGEYRARISFGGLDSLSEDGLDGDDRYLVQLWPGPAAGLRVLKWRAA